MTANVAGSTISASASYQTLGAPPEAEQLNLHLVGRPGPTMASFNWSSPRNDTGPVERQVKEVEVFRDVCRHGRRHEQAELPVEVKISGILILTKDYSVEMDEVWVNNFNNKGGIGKRLKICRSW